MFEKILLEYEVKAGERNRNSRIITYLVLSFIHCLTQKGTTDFTKTYSHFPKKFKTTVETLKVTKRSETVVPVPCDEMADFYEPQGLLSNVRN